MSKSKLKKSLLSIINERLNLYLNGDLQRFKDSTKDIMIELDGMSDKELKSLKDNLMRKLDS